MKLCLSISLAIMAAPSLAAAAPGIAHLADTTEAGRPLALSV